MSNPGYFSCDEITSGSASLVRMVAPEILIANTFYRKMPLFLEFKKKKKRSNFPKKLTAWARSGTDFSAVPRLLEQ